jgi:magnesium transporter
VFQFHPLAIEDTRNQRQRPKVEEYPGYLFTILNAVSLQGDEVTFTELDVFAGERYIVTVHMDAQPTIDEARRRVDEVCQLRPMSAAYLLYALLDVVVDSYFPILEDISDDIEEIGDAIFETPTQDSLQRLFLLKRGLSEMWRVVNQQRDMFLLLMRENSWLVTDEALRFYMRDVYDHLLRIGDNINTFRETATNTVELYMSAVSNRLNQQVNRLTIITMGIGVLAVITGFYGMNFEQTWPPFTAPWGVPFVLALILVTLLGILRFVYMRK